MSKAGTGTVKNSYGSATLLPGTVLISWSVPYTLVDFFYQKFYCVLIAGRFKVFPPCHANLMIISIDIAIQCCGSGMFIPDPGSRVKKITDLRSASKNISTHKIVSKLSEI